MPGSILQPLTHSLTTLSFLACDLVRRTRSEWSSRSGTFQKPCLPARNMWGRARSGLSVFASCLPGLGWCPEPNSALGNTLKGMPNLRYHGLPEYGLPLVTSEVPEFSGLVRDIRARPGPGRPWSTADLDTAAVLLNQTEKAIIVLTYLWRYTTAQGAKRTSRVSNLGSSIQTDYLSRRRGMVRDLGNFILPGSTRLITEQGMFGNNLDVLPQDTAAHSGGYIGGGGGGFRRSIKQGTDKEEIAEVELVLDVAILEDGLCVGPDEGGLVGDLIEDLDQQQRAAQAAVEALRGGGSLGQVFELIRPLARRYPRFAGRVGRRSPTVLLSMFGRTAIRHLVNAPESDLISWFERIAEITPIRLHRPS
jgi:hypothetical protein